MSKLTYCDACLDPIVPGERRLVLSTDKDRKITLCMLCCGQGVQLAPSVSVPSKKRVKMDRAMGQVEQLGPQAMRDVAALLDKATFNDDAAQAVVLMLRRWAEWLEDPKDSTDDTNTDQR